MKRWLPPLRRRLVLRGLTAAAVSAAGARPAPAAATPAMAAEPFPGGATLLVAGPAGGDADRWAGLLTPGLARVLPAGTPLHRAYSGGLDGVTGANQFAARAEPDGATALLLPGAAALAWLIGDTRAHFDIGPWLGVFAALSPGVLCARAPGPAWAGGPVRIAAAGPAGPELAALLGLELLGLPALPRFGVHGVEAAMRLLAQGAVDAVFVQGRDAPARVAALRALGALPLFSIGIPADMVAGETMPDTVVPGAVVPGSVVPGLVAPGLVAPGAAMPGAAVPGSVLPGAAVPGALVSGAALRGAVLPTTMVSGVAMPGAPPPGDMMAAATAARANRAGGVRSGVAMAGDAAPGAAVPGAGTAGDRAPGERVPGDRVPGDRVPGDRVPGDRVPGAGTPGDDALVIRDPLFPEVPLLEEQAAAWHRSLGGPRYGAWCAAAAATRLDAALVLPAATPAAMVALWRRGSEAGLAAPALLRAAAEMPARPLGAAGAAAALAAIAAESAALLELRRWLAVRYRWQPS
jgi:hypothetical protein